MAAGCTFIGAHQGSTPGLRNFHRVDEVLWRGGRPDQDGWQRLRSMGVRSVISLEKDEQVLKKEQETVRSLGMAFYAFPMSVTEAPQDEQVLRFLDSTSRY